jgi:hypothetical protein
LIIFLGLAFLLSLFHFPFPSFLPPEKIPTWSPCYSCWIIWIEEFNVGLNNRARTNLRGKKALPTFPSKVLPISVKALLYGGNWNMTDFVFVVLLEKKEENFL